jgi:hypothetical protein
MAKNTKGLTMRYLLPLFLILACAAPETKVPPKLTAIPPQSASLGAALTPPNSTSAPSSKPTSTTKPADKLPRTVIATFVDGEGPIIACGVIAFIGVYVYEIESVETGEPISGKIVVDLLCPDFLQGKVKLKKGERHLLTLQSAKKSYAGASAPKPPQEDLPRYEAKSIKPAP